MSDELLSKILMILEEASEPLLAREITAIVNQRWCLAATKREINSRLYGSRAYCGLNVDSHFKWSVGRKNSQHQASEKIESYHGLEMSLHRPSKETENKLRWATWVEQDSTAFELYIPKIQVPEPWPGRVWTSLSALAGGSASRLSIPPRSSRLEPIDTIVEFVSVHTRTHRYAPLGDPKGWLVGEPYIPMSLIPRNGQYLLIHVEWDLTSLGQFRDVPTYRDDL